MNNACAGLLGVSCLDLNLMIDMSTIKSLGKVSAPKGKDPWTDVWSFHRFEKRHMIDSILIAYLNVSYFF